MKTGRVSDPESCRLNFAFLRVVWEGWIRNSGVVVMRSGNNAILEHRDAMNRTQGRKQPLENGNRFANTCRSKCL